MERSGRFDILSNKGASQLLLLIGILVYTNIRLAFILEPGWLA
jgi:hypothetical protein